MITESINALGKTVPVQGFGNILNTFKGNTDAVERQNLS